jgi:hypothetical protein
MCFGMQPADDIYNNARLIFHAVGPKFDLPKLEGIDPSVSISAMEAGLENLLETSPNMPAQMRARIANAQKSLARAKTNYLICIGLVKLTDEPSSVDKMALELSQDAKRLTQNESEPSILFIGGHYLYSILGALGGHTAAYDAMRQEDGKLSFIVINTLKEVELVYSDLEATDLDTDLWKNVIKTNYMNPTKGEYLMQAFYEYIDKKLNKGSNKTVGRSFHRQVKGVCGWKAVSVWLHGKIAPGKRSIDRIACDELTYLHYKKSMFEKMAARFKPDSSLALQAGVTLKAELEKKIQKITEDCTHLILNDV